MCSDGIRLVVDEKENSKYFVYSLINSPAFRATVEKAATGSTRKRIGLDQLKNLPMFLPRKAEQQKIADCLGSLDDLIAAHGANLDALQDHKKGLLQQLFPAEGQTIPKLRSPEFQNAGEWNEESIENLGDVVTGSTPKTSQHDFYDGDIPFVSPADIKELRFVDQTKTTLTEAGLIETRSIKARSVLFVCIGSTIGKVAQNVRTCATNQQVNSIIPNRNHSDAFVYFLLAHASKRISQLAGKQAVPIINKSLFSSVRILVPTLPEQQKIADCLGSIAASIAAQTEKIAALKKHKKGLMQQLFPNPPQRFIKWPVRPSCSRRFLLRRPDCLRVSM